jgi:hypothetical protein
MKTVRLSREMRPHHKGADVIMPDDVAEQMVRNGDAEDPRPFPHQPVDAEKPRPAKTYVTKDARPKR